MSVKIRLARGGAKKRPYYRIVVADVRAPRDGRYIERIGHYNPMLPKDHDQRIKIDAEKAKEWIQKGALPTDRVARFLSQLGLWDSGKRPEQTKQHLPKAKAQERAKEAEEKKEAEKAAKEEAAKAAKAEAEAEAEASAAAQPEANEGSDADNAQAATDAATDAATEAASNDEQKEASGA